MSPAIRRPGGGWAIEGEGPRPAEPSGPVERLQPAAPHLRLPCEDCYHEGVCSIQERAKEAIGTMRLPTLPPEFSIASHGIALDCERYADKPLIDTLLGRHERARDRARERRTA